MNASRTARQDRTFEQSLKARDPQALERFFDEWFPLIHGYVRRQVGDEHTAEDLTQDIFLNIHRAIESYDPERDLEPWVYRIATNKIRDHWRSRHRRHYNPVDDEDVNFAESTALSEELPEESLIAGEANDDLRVAVERLPESLRDTVVMRIYEGASFEAIGEALGRNATAVRKRYSRALAALREFVDPAQFGFNETA